ncbi:UNVERIFIED_CONTAM: hypothetical protein Sangu_0090300 [Sesamum angustifolium]|uniref:Uncharacterized protein n=1 Tax=Sesamum angustifolium TaxID=2727405 RepID=A0AAW2RJP8_9LAMI
MQNLQINQPNQQQSGNLGGSAPRPPNTTPFGQQPPPFTGIRPGPLPPFTGIRPGPTPPGVFPRGPVPPNAPAQTTLPPNMVSTRPTGPPSVSQPPPFASRPPPPGVLPSQIGGPAAPSVSGPGPRPGSVSSSPRTSGPPSPTHMSASGPVSNGPPIFAPGMAQVGHSSHLPWVVCQGHRLDLLSNHMFYRLGHLLIRHKCVLGLLVHLLVHHLPWGNQRHHFQHLLRTCLLLQVHLHFQHQFQAHFNHPVLLMGCRRGHHKHNRLSYQIHSSSYDTTFLLEDFSFVHH